MTLLVVVIGRNEGERLRRCLHSIACKDRLVVYVDSGSTDGSIELARTLGAEVVELEKDRPFTAARARNAGWKRGRELAPSAELIHFVDGDCELATGWLDIVVQYMKSHRECVAVCGRLRERNPNANIYHRLCAVEWNAPVGQTDACGGIACYRVVSLEAVNGFREDMLAGEEPELCYRLRQQGGIVMRLDCEMATHDADMTSVFQWWSRAVRAGHAYAEGEFLTRKDPNGLWRREVRSIWFWGSALPLITLLFAWPTRGWSLLLLLAYAILWLRIAIRNWSRLGGRTALLYGLSCVIAKFAQVFGVARFHLNRWSQAAKKVADPKPVSASITGGGI